MRLFAAFLTLLYLCVSQPLPLDASSVPPVSKSAFDAVPAPISVLPVTIEANRIHFTAMVSGKPLIFLLDTGSTTSVVFESASLPAEMFNLGPTVKVAFPALNRTAQSQRIHNLKLDLSGISFDATDSVFMNQNEKVNLHLDRNYDGIVGQEFFRTFTVEIDPQTLTLSLYPTGTDLAKYYQIGHKVRMSDGLPHIRHRSKMPWEQRASPKDLLLDTGYPGHVVIWDRRQFRAAFGFYTSHQKSGILTLGTLTFGNLSFVNTPIFVSGKIPKNLTKRDGIFGASLLNQFKHVIDFENKQILIRPLYHANGAPMQFVDGQIYTPANEKYVLRLYEDHNRRNGDFTFQILE